MARRRERHGIITSRRAARMPTAAGDAVAASCERQCRMAGCSHAALTFRRSDTGGNLKACERQKQCGGGRVRAEG